jgi:calcium-translocating P-type ATPase
MIFAIGVLVALVPEGLLPTLSLSLAIGAQRMARRNVLVRRLSAIEALGATQVICTDKTGTLTLNRMTPALAWTKSGEHDFAAPERAPAGADLLDLLATMTFASSATPAEVSASPGASGPDPIEVAIVAAARDAGVQIASRRLRELPFDSFRRMMSTVDFIHGRIAVHTKGAPDAVLARCSPDTLARFAESPEQVADRYGSMGMRVLAAARRPLSASELEAGEDIEQELEFVGLMAFADPVRPEVVDAVQKCTRAGIRLLIITGDHPGTAAAVAEKAGVSAGRPHVVTGADLEKMSPGELRAALSRDVVFARATPAHKLSIVAALQEMGQVVAVVGDGVNDAPSLRHADVGVAMGKSGTDVAREAADIVLADDNFATIVDGIEEGRAIFANIRRFVTYVFTSNVAELAPFVAYVLTGIPLPLKVLQILAVDVGTDLVPALGLGAEPPEARALEEPPRRRGERLLNGTVLRRIFVFFGPAEAAFALGGFFFVYWLDGWRPGDQLADSGATYLRATTMTFAAIVVGQMGTGLACATSIRSVFSNRLLLVGSLIEAAIVLLLGRVPPLQDTLGFVPLGWREFAYLAMILPVIPALEMGRRALVRRRVSSPRPR